CRSWQLPWLQAIAVSVNLWIAELAASHSSSSSSSTSSSVKALHVNFKASSKSGHAGKGVVATAAVAAELQL
ncbi:MAG: hypothetical protein ACT6T3_22275, partial [Agrobacterium sp.]|uniref:hypothetical protein n=1 Tax=Agrobacterium sp. TaxID=361 RepID=UPI0040336F83